MYLFPPAAAEAETVLPADGIAAGVALLMTWTDLEEESRWDSRVGRADRVDWRRLVQRIDELVRRISR